MEYRELYAETERRLREAGCDSPAFDAVCLLEDVGGLPRGTSPRLNARTVPADKERAVRDAAEDRAAGRPLQYILGNWEFLTLTLSVGEGVLIPRPDTELLCEAAAARLPLVPGGDAPRVLDLCAGSGCVGLGLCSLYPAAAVTAVELSDEAFVYLKENTARYPAYRVWPIQADVLADGERFGGVYQAVLANPPYIPAGGAALPDAGGAAGAPHGAGWRRRLGLLPGNRPGLGSQALPRRLLRRGGGAGQAAAVSALFEEVGLTGLEILEDLGGIQRVVVGWRE